jgi:hypothetical protein
MQNIDFFIKGTNSSLGTVINMAALPGDFVMTNSVERFYICIESAGAIVVQLENGDTFTISAVQAASYLGLWYPASIKKVFKAGTAGTFSFGF